MREGGTEGGLAELRGSGSDKSSIRVHGVIITPRNFTIPAFSLSLRVEFLAPHFIAAEVGKAYKGFNKLDEVKVR